MSSKNCKLEKQGNIFIPVGVIILVIIFATIFLVYYQVNIIIDNVRKDLFYASNNAILSFDVSDLAYNKYTVNENKTKEVIEYILNKNYAETQGSVTKIQIIDLKMTPEQNEVKLFVEAQVTFKSLINIVGKKEHKFNMNESIKISLLDYR